MQDLKPLYEAILNGDDKTAKATTEQALAAGAEPMVIVQKHMMPAMAEVGRRFECDEYFVPELMLSARAMKEALSLIRPLLAASGTQATAKVAVGTVKGDLHDIGKNLVAAVLEGGGYEVLDLGVNVAPEQFVTAVREQGADIVAMSALLTTTMPSMKATLDALENAGVRQNVKVLVGGAPITRKFAEEIGADGFSETAVGAVEAAKTALQA